MKNKNEDWQQLLKAAEDVLEAIHFPLVEAAPRIGRLQAAVDRLNDLDVPGPLDVTHTGDCCSVAIAETKTMIEEVGDC